MEPCRALADVRGHSSVQRISRGAVGSSALVDKGQGEGTYSQKQVNILDKVEEVIPRPVLSGVGVVCQIALDCGGVRAAH